MIRIALDAVEGCPVPVYALTCHNPLHVLRWAAGSVKPEKLFDVAVFVGAVTLIIMGYFMGWCLAHVGA